MNRTRTTTDVAQRSALYEKAQELVKEEAPWVTMNHSLVCMVVRDEVQNYKVDPFGGQYF
jgi:dipeptide transport system substrate-binding protein